MTDQQITVYLSVAGSSTGDVFRRVRDLLKNMGYQVIDVSGVSPIFPVSNAFETAVIDLMRRSNIFIGILCGDDASSPAPTDAIVIETGRRPLEIEYSAATMLAIPRFVYSRDTLRFVDSWLARFLARLTTEHTVELFRSDDDLLKHIQSDVPRLIRQRSRPSEEAVADSTEASSSEEGYNEHLEAARDQVAQLYQQADYLLRYNKLSGAANLYQEIIGILPNEFETYGKLRDVLERLGRTEEAEQLAAEIKERFPVGAAANAGEVPSSAASSSGTSQQSASAAATSSDQGPKEAPSGRSASPAGLGYSPETLRALAIAEELRGKLDQLVILRRFLLFGLSEQNSDSLASLMLKSLGISREQLLGWLRRGLRGLSRAGARPIDAADLLDTAAFTSKLIDERSLAFRFSDSVQRVLASAELLARNRGRSDIRPDDVFVALMLSTEYDPGWIGWMLSNDKAEWVRRILADWSGETQFSEGALRDKAVEAGFYSPPSASSDAAAKDDLLNFKQSACAMVNIVLKRDTVPPLVIGVYGPWGSGKSTYMELVKKELLSQYERIKKNTTDEAKSVDLLVVEYDAWAYSDAPKLWAGLITRIAKKLDEDLGWLGRTKYMFDTHRRKLVGGILLGLIPMIIGLPIVVFDLVKSLPSWAPVPSVISAVGAVFSATYAWFAQRQAVFKNVSSLASKFDSAPASGVINSIQDEFKDALESWIRQKTGSDSGATIEQRVRDNNLKIVVFIDELDRCPLERIVDILEAIKLFLAKEIFIVFMAVDTRVASEAIRLHYKDVRNPDLPREYLEKIVQLPLRVPTAKRDVIDGYLRKFMPNVQRDIQKEAEPSPAAEGMSGTSASTVAGPTAVVALSKAQPGVRTPSSIPLTPAVTGVSSGNARAGKKRKASREFDEPSPTFSLPQLPDTQTELELLAAIAEELLDSNPRRIKRLLNTYRYIKVLSHGLKEPVQTAEWQKTMLGWLAFTMTWPSFMAKAIERVPELTPEDDGFLSRAIGAIADHQPRPSEAHVQTYLNVSGKRIKELWELAGNFLIENADPGSVSHTDVQVNTRSKSPA